MKVLVALAVATATAVAAYSHDDCDVSEYANLAPFTSLDALRKCEEASGWSMFLPTGEPTEDQLSLMCINQACSTLIDATEAITPGDCDLVFGNARLNVKQFVEMFKTRCSALAIPTDA